MISIYEKQYIGILKQLCLKGSVSELSNVSFSIDLEQGFPDLESKVVTVTLENDRYVTELSESVLNYFRECLDGSLCIADSNMDSDNLSNGFQTSIWSVEDGRLNCALNKEFCDVMNIPSDIIKFSKMIILFAKDLNLNVGILDYSVNTVSISDERMIEATIQSLTYDVIQVYKSAEAYR